MVFGLMIDHPARWNAYKLAFGFTALSYLFYFLSLPFVLFALLAAGLLCLAGGLFFPHTFDHLYRTFQFLVLGILSFLVSLFILIGYLIFWRPLQFILGSKNQD
ncbi:hypothetical protein [Leptospira haakeii]|uniref:Uncharacterized protein n=1 Tax=Leptospira haakeii TaxID=2023198 RepID=A0ABX4PM08_9LEPT|nr:hypothetical protein [Leptospira haakeii]PKA15418.1 hypothetical protein CH363_13865 [Leptospira haakeii]PKA18278.1 hypothetical protein CH377_18615 [Leptospira haakeii]